MLKGHKAELAASIDTLLAYFVRTNGKNKRQGQSALDHFSTVIYSSLSTVSAQYIFCQTMSSIGRDVIYAPRGAMGEFRSEEHTSELQSLMRTSYAVCCLKKKLPWRGRSAPGNHTTTYYTSSTHY